MEKKYYRNTKSVISMEGITIDEGYLWELKGNNLLVLVDEDQYISCELDVSFFTEAEL